MVPTLRDAAPRGESLAVAEVEPGRTESVVKALRLSGSPVIFVVSTESGADWTFEDQPAQEPGPAESTGSTRRAILARLRQDSAALDEACADLTEAARLDHSLSPAAEWILDNSYLIHTQIIEVERHLPRDHHAGTSGGNGRRPSTRSPSNWLQKTVTT